MGKNPAPTDDLAHHYGSLVTDRFAQNSPSLGGAILVWRMLLDVVAA